MQPTKNRVLCVSDQADTCENLTAWLARRGYEVVTAQSLVTAILVACGQVFSLYVLDVEFWGGAGTRLYESIRECDPLAPIILFSSAAKPNALREALEADATRYVHEPDPDRLVEALQGIAFGAASESERAAFARH